MVKLTHGTASMELTVCEYRDGLDTACIYVASDR